MSFKGDTIIEMAHAVKRLTERKVLTPEQMERIGDDMPVAAMRDARLFMQYIDRCQVDLVNAANVLSWACANQEFLSLIKADAGVTYRQAKEGVDRAQTNIIVIHRVGYILHETMLTVGDLLERDRRMKFAVKKHYRDAEDCWRRYEHPRQQRAERAWDDFMRLLRNDDLTDQTALHAIELNPIAQEHYRSVLEEADRERQQQEQQEIADSISRLAEKYKVTKQ